ncbi:MAG: GldM family protein [Bacteroidota bacterium]|jgi:hypothetical protein
MKTFQIIEKKAFLIFISLFVFISSSAQTRTAIDFKVRLDTTLYEKTVPLEVLLHTDSLSIVRKHVRVNSFRSTFIFKGGNSANLIDEISQSNRITANMKAAISALQKGDRILIENIVVITKGNKLTLAPPLILTVN